MNKLILSFFMALALFMLPLNAKSQDQRPSNRDAKNIKEVTVSGKVIDQSTKEPLEYATIIFVNKNTTTTGGITDALGNFSISVPTGMYDISIEYIGFTPQSIKNKQIIADESLGIFPLEINMESLGEVEIIAEKTTVEIKLDKKIYNVGKDLTVSGGNVSDVLDNIPSVTVDVEGNVALRGNDNVRILINGKPSGLVGLNSTEALRQLPAESIEKVEVITSPSARYESEGTAGILNIILRRSKLQGLNGAITTNLGHPSSAGISGNINYRTGDVNFFNTTAYNYREYLGHSYTYTQYKAAGNFLDEKQDWVNTQKGLTTNFGLEWYINDSASLTTSIVLRDSDKEQDSKNKLLQYDKNLNFTGETNRLNPEFGADKTFQYSANFTKNFKTSGHQFSFDFQYENSDEDENSIVITNNLATDKVARKDEQRDILLQSDYVLPIGEKSQFELGYRGNFNTRNTDFDVELLNTDTNQFEVDNTLSNVFNFKQYINAVYTQYGIKINKFSYLLGLRMENTQITIDQPTTGEFKKKNFTGLFPTINLSYELSENENITLGYSRRLQRPRGYYLNPFPSRTSLTNIFQGNPDLNPSYSGLYDLGYLNRFGKFTLSTSIYHQHETNDSNWVSEETGEIVTIEVIDSDVPDASPKFTELPVIRRTPVNMATNDRYGFEFNLNYSPNRKWRINTDFNFFKSITKGDYNGVNYDAENVSWNIRLSNKYTLPGNIDWQTNMDYRGPRQDAQNKRDAVFSANLALSKDLFKEKASIAFNINDLLNSRRYKGEIETDTFFSTRDVQYRGGRTYNLSFTYRFNQKKKVERSRDYQDNGDMDM